MKHAPKPYWPAAVAAGVGILLYAITLGGTYVYDDEYIAHLDPRLHHLNRWGEFLTRAYFPGAPDRLWRPVTSYSFAVEWWAHGDRPWVMHLINLLLYAGVCALVAELARKLGGIRAAWVAGILFAVHPAHVECVTYLVGRADLFCALGLLGGILFFLSGSMTTRRALAIWACMVFAILTKEPGMLLPALLVAWVPWRRQAIAAQLEGEREGQSIKLLVLLLSWTLAGYIVFREQSKRFKFSWDPAFLDATMNPLPYAPWGERFLVPFSLVGRYVQLLLCPWRLSLDYSGWIGQRFHWDDPYFYLGIAAVIVWWVGLVWAVRRKAWGVVGAMACMVITYAMVSNFGIIIGAIFGERLIFMPSAFFLVLVGMGVARVKGRWWIPALVVVLLLGAVRTETYAWRWKDALGLYTSLAKEQPQSARLRMLMMDRLRETGDYEGAARAGAEGIVAEPGYWRIWYYTALVAAERHRYDEAKELIAQGLKLKHTDPGSFGALLSGIGSGEFDKPTSRPTTPKDD